MSNYIQKLTSVILTLNTIHEKRGIFDTLFKYRKLTSGMMVSGNLKRYHHFNFVYDQCSEPIQDTNGSRFFAYIRSRGQARIQIHFPEAENDRCAEAP